MSLPWRGKRVFLRRRAISISCSGIAKPVKVACSFNEWHPKPLKFSYVSCWLKIMWSRSILRNLLDITTFERIIGSVETWEWGIKALASPWSGGRPNSLVFPRFLRPACPSFPIFHGSPDCSSQSQSPKYRVAFLGSGRISRRLDYYPLWDPRNNDLWEDIWFPGSPCNRQIIPFRRRCHVAFRFCWPNRFLVQLLSLCRPSTLTYVCSVD
jgi:hypothetical protein